jgi:transcription elongation factor GreA
LAADVVGLLSKVEMTNLATDSKKSFTIVSPHEMNLLENKISINSPIAQALMGKKVGDVVEVHVPAGVQKYRIDSIQL